MSNIVQPYGFAYEAVGAGVTAQVLGGTGATGDYLDTLIITVATAATGTVTLLDGSTSIAITAANTPIGVYTVKIGALSNTGPWKITTGAGASVIATGIFSA